jgi:hypothetical protein
MLVCPTIPGFGPHYKMSVAVLGAAAFMTWIEFWLVYMAQIDKVSHFTTDEHLAFEYFFQILIAQRR